MRQSLWDDSLNRFNKNAFSYIAVGALCGLFLILAALLSLVDELLLLIAVPLIMLPMIFASYIACYYLKAGQPITMSAVFRYFVGFFRPQFRGSFRGIRSFLSALLFYVGGLFVSYIVMYLVFRNVYGALFSDALTNLIKQYASTSMTYEDLANAMQENDGILLTFIIYVTVLPLPIAILRFIYAISFASISIYYRNNCVGATTSLISLAVNNTYAFFRNKIRKDWFSLNWPLLVLSLLGSIAGGLLAFFFVKDPIYISVFVSLGSVALLGFFLPLYFSNMETLYNRYADAFKEGNKRAIDSILSRIQSSIDLTDDEKRGLEESFKNIDKDE